MKHFLATRFNVKVPDWKTAKNGMIVLSEEWLNNRFYLFENYCLPSVKNQTNQNFVWCVFFDVETPQKYRERIEMIFENSSNFYPVFIEDIDSLNHSFKSFINNSLAEGEDVITTRLDNDDLIHKDFIKTIQILYEQKGKGVIDFKNGYQVSIENLVPQVRLYTHDFNAFVSVIENEKKFETVYSKMHYGWRDSEDVISYKKERLWIELVHSQNKVNHTLTSLYKAVVFDEKNFGLQNFKYKPNAFDVVKTNFTIVVLHFKKLIKRVVKKFFKVSNVKE